jgi:flagellar hook-associated protein 2
VTLDLKEASEDPVTVTVTRDTDTMLAAVQRFVTNFNDVIARIDQYDFYDSDAEKRGVLLGNPTTSRVRNALFAELQKPAKGVGSAYKYLRQVGITIGSDGKIKFDESKYKAAYEADPEAVENLFATFETSTTSTEEISPGITVQKTNTEITASGFGDMFDKLMETLTNSVDGVVTRAKNGFQDIIDLTNDRITAFDQRLEAKRSRLQAQFAAMETALAKLQGQNGSLSQLAASVQLAQRS